MNRDPTSPGHGPEADEDFDGDFLFHFYKAGELLQIGQLEESEKQLEKALELKPGNSKVLNLLGLVYFKLGRTQRSILIYRDLIETYPDDATLRVNLATVYLKNGQLDEAEAELRTAIELKPGHEKAHRTLAVTLGKKGQRERALEHLDQAGFEEPDRLAEALSPLESAESRPEEAPVDSAPPPEPQIEEAPEPAERFSPVPERVVEPSTPFSLEEGCLVADSPGRLYSRLSTLTAVRGDLKFTAVKKRFEREETKYPFGTGQRLMVEVEGEGQLYFSAQQAGYFLLGLDSQPGYFMEEYVFAFSEVAFWENGRLPSEEKNDPPIFHLQGPAQLVLTCPGKLRSRPLEGEGMFLLNLDKLVGWWGSLSPRVVKIGRPLPAASWIELSGTGQVFYVD